MLIGEGNEGVKGDRERGGGDKGRGGGTCLTHQTSKQECDIKAMKEAKSHFSRKIPKSY